MAVFRDAVFAAFLLGRASWREAGRCSGGFPTNLYSLVRHVDVLQGVPSMSCVVFARSCAAA